MSDSALNLIKEQLIKLQEENKGKNPGEEQVRFIFRKYIPNPAKHFKDVFSLIQRKISPDFNGSDHIRFNEQLWINTYGADLVREAGLGWRNIDVCYSENMDVDYNIYPSVQWFKEVNTRAFYITVSSTFGISFHPLVNKVLICRNGAIYKVLTIKELRSLPDGKMEENTYIEEKEDTRVNENKIEKPKLEEGDDFDYFEVDSKGNRRYYDSDRKLHRWNAPAVVLKDGTEEYWEHGEKYEFKRGLGGFSKLFKNNQGEYHREHFKPAVVTYFGYAKFESLLRNGQYYSDDEHASHTITKHLDGELLEKKWLIGTYENSLAHRFNGPAHIDRRDGHEKHHYYEEGKLIKTVDPTASPKPIQKPIMKKIVFVESDLEKLSELERDIFDGIRKKLGLSWVV